MESFSKGEQMNVSLNDVLKALEGMLANIMTTGAVDSEPRDFELIKERMLSGEISPEDALRQAQELIDSRQSYH